jgi:hypothetical protein
MFGFRRECSPAFAPIPSVFTKKRQIQYILMRPRNSVCCYALSKQKRKGGSLTPRCRFLETAPNRSPDTRVITKMPHGNGSSRMNGTELCMPALGHLSEKNPDQPPAKIALQGHYSLPYWYDPQGKPRSFACRTISVSPFQMKLAVAVGGKIGDRITSCFPELGHMNGSITDAFAGGFVFEPNLTDLERERVANKLIWLEKKRRDPAVRDARRHERFIPANPHSMLTLADGSTRSCFVIDMSVTGVAVSSEVQPPIGTALAVGACVGRVVRLLPEGFAVQFAEIHRRHDLNRLLLRGDLAPASRNGSGGSPDPSTAPEQRLTRENLRTNSLA